MFQKILAAILSFFSFSFLKAPPPQITPVPAAIVSPTPAANITIDTPRPNESIGYILKITGSARVFENQFQWRLLDANKKIIVSGTSSSNAADAGQFGKYEITSSYIAPSSSSGFVEVFDSSAKDGSEIDLVSVPIQFPAGPTSQVNVYFGKYSLDSTMAACESVVPIKRTVAKTPAIAQAAINSLLAGLTSSENKLYYTSINPGVSLNKLTIENGVAKVDFSSELQKNVGGSCRVASIRAQITQTLKQFPSVKSVVISVDGDSQTALQP